MQHYMTNLALHYQNMGFGHITNMVPTLFTMYATYQLMSMLPAKDNLNASRQTQMNCQQELTLLENGCIDFAPINCQQIDTVDPALAQQLELLKWQAMKAAGAAVGSFISLAGFQYFHHLSSLSQRAWESVGGKQLQSKLVELELHLNGELSPKDQFLHLIVKFFASHRYNCLEKDSTQTFLDYLYDNGLESLLNTFEPDFSSVSYDSFEYNALKLFKEVTRPQDELVPLTKLLSRVVINVKFADDSPDSSGSSSRPGRKLT